MTKFGAHYSAVVFLVENAKALDEVLDVALDGLSLDLSEHRQEFLEGHGLAVKVC